jgi:hypothetical protein
MDFGEITQALLPGTGIVLVVDLLLYIMFFLNLVAFFMQDDKQIMATMLMGLSLLAVVVAKMSTAFIGRRPPVEYFDENHLVMLIVNCAIFVIPIIVAGMSKAKKPKPIMVISGVIGAFYFGMFWFFFQLNA